jgi:hypothetical protein
VLLLSCIPVQGVQSAVPLNVSIAAFDAGVPEDQSLHRDLEIFPRIREIEAMLLPFALRQALFETGEWGAVRIVPEPDDGAELLVTGSIGQSDGQDLEITIRAVDASGRVWLDEIFTGSPESKQFFAGIATELANARAQLTDKMLNSVVEISRLRYGIRLAPSAFTGYLDQADDGTFVIQRLPASNDPMLARIKLVRETEYVITDAVDEKFQQLYAEIASVHDLWRKYRRKNVEYQNSNATRALETRSDAPRGSYESIKNLYDNYKRDRIIAQEQDSLAVAFNNEVGPKVEAMEERVAELEVWVDRKYAEWYRLLEGLFEAETALED